MNKTFSCIFLVCGFLLLQSHFSIIRGQENTEENRATTDQTDMDIIMNLDFFDNIELLENDIDFTENDNIVYSLVQNIGEKHE